VIHDQGGPGTMEYRIDLYDMHFPDPDTPVESRQKGD
jgi:hypothetical protein